MDLPFGNREMVYSNIELRNIKESNPLTRDWNNSIFLGFCRWIGEKRKIDVSFAEEIDDEVDSFQLQGEERKAIVKIRANQGVFREELIKRYGKCVLCGINKRELLIVSHIKPWKYSEPEEKVDVDNGLISFGDGGEIIISKLLDEANSIYTKVRQGMTIELTEGNRKYLFQAISDEYADNSQGFCIEYEMPDIFQRTDELCTNLFPVIYSDARTGVFGRTGKIM